MAAILLQRHPQQILKAARNRNACTQHALGISQDEVVEGLHFGYHG